MGLVYFIKSCISALLIGSKFALIYSWPTLGLQGTNTLKGLSLENLFFTTQASCPKYESTRTGPCLVFCFVVSMDTSEWLFGHPSPLQPCPGGFSTRWMSLTLNVTSVEQKLRSQSLCSPACVVFFLLWENTPPCQTLVFPRIVTSRSMWPECTCVRFPGWESGVQAVGVSAALCVEWLMRGLWQPGLQSVLMGGYALSAF